LTDCLLGVHFFTPVGAFKLKKDVVAFRVNFNQLNIAGISSEEGATILLLMLD
jgi:hypothetical protein